MFDVKSKCKITDASFAVAYVSYYFTEIFSVYPITPSTTMTENIEKFILKNKKNIFDQVPHFIMMQSEVGAISLIHGGAATGSICTTFTSSQGLLLMIPVLYKLAGENLPAVIHVASRCVCHHALSIFCDHSDVYSCKQTGVLIICSNNPQESHDIAILCYCISIKLSMPVIHFFDGFRTSHEITKIKLWGYKELNNIFDKISLKKLKKRSINPYRSEICGTNQNEDVFFQMIEASNSKYDKMNFIIKSVIDSINMKNNSNYDFFEYYGHEDAKIIIVAMGSICNTTEDTIDILKDLNLVKNMDISEIEKWKIGIIKVRVYRPFFSKEFVKKIPKTVTKISVLDRTKEPGSTGESLYLDVLGALNNENIKDIEVFHGRYGIASKNINHNDIISIFKNMKSKINKKHFTVGIIDDITNLSLEVFEYIKEEKDTICVEFWGIGSDGTISASKNILKIIGENSNYFVQGYFRYDSKKSGALTVSYLKFSQNKIKSSCYSLKIDFLILQHFEYMNRYDFTKRLKFNSTVILNSPYSLKDTLQNIEKENINFMYKNKISFFIIDANSIIKKINEEDIGVDIQINIPMQTAFLKIFNNVVHIKSLNEVIKKYIRKSYSSKGLITIEKNFLASDISFEKIFEINSNSFEEITINYDKNLIFENKKKDDLKYKNDFFEILDNIQKDNGNNLPVSSFIKYKNGKTPNGTSGFNDFFFKKALPSWIGENCIQCGLCSIFCPHGIINSFIVSDEQIEKFNLFLKNKKIKYNLFFFNFDKNLKFTIIFNRRKCTGCGICYEMCPKKNKDAITMGNYQSDFLEKLSPDEKIIGFFQKNNENNVMDSKDDNNNVKKIQFKQSLLKYSDACPGCCQTPYVNLLTKIFESGLMIANATGCSSIWGGNFSGVPFFKNKNGLSPSWHNSLFENNAEFALGFCINQKNMRSTLLDTIKEVLLIETDIFLIKILEQYVEKFNIYKGNYEISKSLINIIEGKIGNQKVNKFESDEKKIKLYKKIIENKEYLNKSSIWAIGGDGWAYDIGFNGIDHLIFLNEDLNILVLDTQMYSNTGGQVSKASPENSTNKLSLGKKEYKSKDLISIFSSYKNVFLARVSLGANPSHCIKVFKEANDFPGPSLVVAYSPCIGHGIKGGMRFAQKQAKKASDSGFWPLLKYNPNEQKSNTENKINFENKRENYKEFTDNEQRFK